MPKISRYFIAYLSGLIVVTPNIGGTSDTRAASLGERTPTSFSRSKSETDEAYTDFLDRNLVEWYAAAPKSDRHAPVHGESLGIMTERSRRRGEWGAGRVSEMPYMEQ